MTATDIQIDEKVKIEITEPKRYKVLFLNDDKTPIDFVIDVLMSVFKHTMETAKDLTLKIHYEGSAVVGTFTYEIAEQKGIETTQLARQAGFPLQIKIDPE